MCECNEYQIYEEIVNEFLNKRNLFVKKEWLKFKSITKRMFGKNEEFNRLSHISKMEWRVSFLYIPIAIITVLLSFFKLFEFKDFSIFVILIISLIFGYSEIQKIDDRKSAYKEIIEIIENLDKILQQNDVENK
jgi:hypothetical protein